MTKYTQTYTITNDCMSADYRLTPVSAIMFFQETFARYLTTKKLAAFDVIKDNIIWIVSEYNIEFIDELPFWSENIDVSVWISEMTKLKIFSDFTLEYKGRTIAKGNACWFILDLKTRRPLSTEKIADKIELISDFTLGEHKKSERIDINTKIKEYTHIANISDIDFNDHVNNKSYLHIADSMIGKEFREANKIKSIKIKYLKESFINDALTCSIYSTESENQFVCSITKECKEICNIITMWQPQKYDKEISEYNLRIREKALV